ncbi:MarR family winged helix-turn-helix transcriptional regulator [Novosphingobium taihuense]|uniref:DNA-binding MarR family transcriptional regulator n=1 Tax=Novosphingobium taihuense TaxID=260085 RepID=A0A7W7AD66_9SPHN|nr:MarR family transcriptional regulator [Novosphingobium taihuense]MBB4614863.1 DNA-binding MarR family transcriptional regulator [Novosphingobium taihuense]TWH84696.1 DNA-binding MarR family transcriptional regulator [Novosphingobium taihuense]
MRNPLEDLVGFHLVRTASFGLRVVNEAYGDLGVRHPDAAVMMVIEANPGITQSSIGRMLKIQRSNMVPIIGRLAERGWIEREQGKGKRIGISLSPEGVQIMGTLRAASQAGEDAIASRLGTEGYSTLHDLLRQIS